MKKQLQIFILFLGFMLLPMTQVMAHGVQVAYTQLNNGFLRVYIEHWHGNLNSNSLNNNGANITMTYGSTTVTQNLDADGFYNNTSLSSLPGAPTSISACAGSGFYSANYHNNWVYYDFAPAVCGQAVTITINQGNTVLLTEACSNLYPASVTATFYDNSPPVLTCADINVEACGTTNVSYSVTASDACDPNPSISYSIASGSAFSYGTTQVTATATDNQNQSSTCTFNVNVFDNTDPTALCNDATVYTGTSGIASLTASDIDNGSTDACGILSLDLSQSAFTCADEGTNAVTLTVTDNNNNTSTCNATVTVVSTPPNLTLSSAPNTSGTVIGSTTTYAATDQMFLGYGAQSMIITASATGGNSFSYSWTGSYLSSTSVSNPIFTPTQEGNYTLTCTVTNDCGATSTESITICVINAKGNGGNANNPKVLICHRPSGNPNNTQNISVSVNAVTAHLGNHGGCTLGACGSGCSSLNSYKVGGETTLEGEIANKSTNSVNVYPNPNNGSFGLEVFSENDGIMNVTVFDMFGKEVYILENQELSGFIRVPISLDGVRRAQYFVRVTIDGKVFTKAVLVNP